MAIWNSCGPVYLVIPELQNGIGNDINKGSSGDVCDFLIPDHPHSTWTVSRWNCVRSPSASVMKRAPILIDVCES
jgi:hypothetical protein